MKTNRLGAACRRSRILIVSAALRLALPAMCILPAAQAVAADVDFVAVLKGQRYKQPGPDLVMLDEDDGGDDGDDGSPLVFEAFAKGTTADSLVAGVVYLPASTMLDLPRDPDDPTRLLHAFPAEDPLALNTARPDGNYRLNFVTQNEGPMSVILNLSGNSFPVPVPRASNHAALQAINHAAATTVLWPAVVSGSASDFIMFSVWGENGTPVFQTPGPGAPGALDGTATQAVIPANILQAGRTYEGQIIVVRTTTVTATYPMSVAGFYRATTFEMRTVPLPATPLGARLDSVLPPRGMWEVPRDSAVSFRFTQPMNPAEYEVNWSGAGLNPANFSYQWLDGDRLLLCRYSGLLPLGQQIGWTLNLAVFEDQAGFALAGSQSGSFETSTATPAGGTDVDGCYLIKARGYRQAGPEPLASGLFGCEADVEMPAFNRVKEPATLTIAGNGYTARLEPDDWDPQLYLEATYPSKAALDALLPNGIFTFNLETLNHGAQPITLDLGATDDYPAPPKITNLPALQATDPAAATTITWDTLAGWTATPTVGGSFAELEIENDQGQEVFFGEPGDPSITASQCTIPAGTLWPGRLYQATLSFTKVKAANSTYVNGFNGAGFRSVTEFIIQTAGSPLMPAATLVRAGQGMNLIFRGGEPQRHYVVETSNDLARWVAQQDRWIGDPVIPNQFYDPDASYLPQRWYRLRDRMAGEDWVQPPVSIQGTVWTDHSRTTPVAGAAVDTDLDGSSTTTDAAGRFFLETDTRGDFGSTPYTIRVTVGAQTTSFGPWTWGQQPRQQQFELH